MEKGKISKKLKRRWILMTACVVLISLFFVWKAVRANSAVPVLDASNVSQATYEEREGMLHAIALSYLVYGCEKNEKNEGTVSDILAKNEMGIILENFGIVREKKEDPSTAILDTEVYVENQVGQYRFLCERKDAGSGFYGAAFCDDENQCIWIAFSGSVDTRDTLACVAMVLKPGLSAQEKNAFCLMQSVLERVEIREKRYGIILTGHSLGGALASEVSRVSGCQAITINGVNGIALDKVNAIMNDDFPVLHITSYLTSPKNGKFSMMDLVQRFMFLGDYQQVDYHVYEQNEYTTDTHSVFSFLVLDQE